MKIYVSHSTGFNFKNKLYEPLRTSKLNDEHTIVLPHEEDVALTSKEIIIRSDVIVAEVSYPSTGEGIELGWASDSHIPIICVYKEGRKISGSLKVVSNTFISYRNSRNLITNLEKKKLMLIRIDRDGYGALSSRGSRLVGKELRYYYAGV